MASTTDRSWAPIRPPSANTVILGLTKAERAAEHDRPLAAGHDSSVPRIFVTLADIATLIAAFAATKQLAPWVQWLLLPSGPFHLSLPAWIGLPEGASPGNFAALPNLTWVLIVAVPTTVLFLDLLGGYQQMVDQTRARVALSSILSPLLSLSIVTLTLFTLKDANSSRVFIFTFGGISIAVLLGCRLAFWVYQHGRLAAGAYARNVILVGRPSAIAWMTEHFRSNAPANRFRLAGWLSVPFESGTDAQIQLPCLASVEQLGDILIHRPLHEVIAIQSAGDTDWMPRVIEDCDYFHVRLRIVPEALLAGTVRDLKLVFRSEPLRLPEVVLEPPHYESEALFLKRVIDVVLSAALLVVLSPLLLLIAVAIKLTTPMLPVLYPWRVIGLKGRPFTGYKFTTMVADADERQSELTSRNEMSGPVFKLKDDPRITPLGRFLRKFSLNELPQLWSVLNGDMSLVGPRPAFRHELDRYMLWHKRKLCVKPGMTCLWQVSGRNRIRNFDEWVRLDLEYIDRWSLSLDFRILARTVWTVVSGSGW
jgi:exopolysaccharide biosynthesis polyprenyl glycosylphosphotransferase